MTVIFLALLVSLLTVLLMFSAINGMFSWRAGGVRVEKITEKQVYIESSAAMTALDTFRRSVVTVLPREVISNVPLLPQSLQTVCYLDGKNCDSLAVVLTSDGLVLAGFDLDDRLVEQLVALDYLGKVYDLRVRFSFEGYTVMQLVPEGVSMDSNENRNNYVNLRPVNLTGGGALATAQRLLVLKESLAAWDRIEETLISSLKENDRFLTRVGEDEFFVEMGLDDYISHKGDLLFDLSGGLVALVLKDGKLLTSDQIEALLQRLTKNPENPSPLDWGLSCLVLDKALADGLNLQTDYGCLITDGIDATYKLHGGGLIKGGAAERLGLRSGDLVLEIDGRSLLDVGPLEILSQKAHGENIQLTVWRGEQRLLLNGVL